MVDKIQYVPPINYSILHDHFLLMQSIVRDHGTAIFVFHRGDLQYLLIYDNAFQYDMSCNCV